MLFARENSGLHPIGENLALANVQENTIKHTRENITNLLNAGRIEKHIIKRKKQGEKMPDKIILTQKQKQVFKDIGLKESNTFIVELARRFFNELLAKGRVSFYGCDSTRISLSGL